MNLGERYGRDYTNIPRSDSVAWVIKCDYNKRYFWSLHSRSGTPLTVGLMHAERYSTRDDAEWALRQVRAAGPNLVWRVVRLVRRPETATGEETKR